MITFYFLNFTTDHLDNQTSWRPLSSIKPTVNAQHQVNNNKSTTWTTATRPSLVKTNMGPPDVQPAFNNSQRITTTPIENQPSQQQLQQQDTLTNRAGSLAVVAVVWKHAVLLAAGQTWAALPLEIIIENTIRFRRLCWYSIQVFWLSLFKSYPTIKVFYCKTGTRPQTRLPNSGMVANAPLRGANNIGFPRPMGATNANSDVPMRQQQQQQQQQISTTASRGASQPRKISFPVSLSYAVQPSQQQQKQVVQPSAGHVLHCR